MAVEHVSRKVYVAGRYQDRDDCIRIKDRLIQEGFTVVARWLEIGDAANPMSVIKADPDLCDAIATRDVEDIEDADVLVLCSPAKAHGSGTGGRHVEFGIAQGSGKSRILLGERENVEVTQSQVAATVASLLGEDFNAASPKAARPFPLKDPR